MTTRTHPNPIPALTALVVGLFLVFAMQFPAVVDAAMWFVFWLLPRWTAVAAVVAVPVLAIVAGGSGGDRS